MPENREFLHMGCDLEKSKEAASLSGTAIVEQMYAGSKLSGTIAHQKKYYEEYDKLISLDESIECLTCARLSICAHRNTRLCDATEER